VFVPVPLVLLQQTEQNFAGYPFLLRFNI